MSQADSEPTSPARVPDPGSVAALMDGCTCPIPDPEKLLMGFDHDGVGCLAVLVDLDCPMHAAQLLRPNASR